MTLRETFFQDLRAKIAGIGALPVWVGVPGDGDVSTVQASESRSILYILDVPSNQVGKVQRQIYKLARDYFGDARDFAISVRPVEDSVEGGVFHDLLSRARDQQGSSSCWFPGSVSQPGLSKTVLTSSEVRSMTPEQVASLARDPHPFGVRLRPDGSQVFRVRAALGTWNIDPNMRKFGQDPEGYGRAS